MGKDEYRIGNRLQRVLKTKLWGVKMSTMQVISGIICNSYYENVINWACGFTVSNDQITMNINTKS